jgi:hypothetical protein
MADTVKKTHNLDVHMYSLEELLGLFNLTYQISIDDLKRAKKTVLMTHPDKSKLPSNYFLFYKKAFDIIVQYYENQHKQNKVVPTEKTNYEPIKSNDFNHSTTKKVSSVINEMSVRDFQNTFNKLFDENMSNKPDKMRNEWFSKEEPIHQVTGNVSVSNMGQMFDQMKESNSGTALSQYRGVENLYVNSGTGSRLYDDDDDDSQYVSCDPFSKLKYDDLRKVHKDQTMFAVSERDINKVKQYSSVDHFMNERGKQSLTPIDKTSAEQMLSKQEQQFRENLMKKEHASKLQTLQYAEKNKSILSSFLQLK